MKKTRISLVLAFIFVFSLFGSTAFAADCTVIPTPLSSTYTITSPGIYCLNGDSTWNNQYNAAIYIDSDNVVLDFNGHTLTSLVGNVATAVRSLNHGNITIKNGVLKNFPYGIYITADDWPTWEIAKAVVIENMKIIQGNYAIYLAGSKGFIVRNNEVLGSSTWLSGADGRVINNDIRETPHLGIGIFNAPSTVVENNRVSNWAVTTGTTGIALGNASLNVLVTNNHIINMETGIEVLGAANSMKYRDNLTFGCTTPYSILIGGVGVDAGNNN